MSEFTGELLGTAMLVLLGDGVIAGVLLNKSKSQNSGWIVIATGWCLAVLCGIFVAQAFGSPGANINPAVTLALMINGTHTLGGGLYLMLAQLIGAFIGAFLVWLHYLPHWKETEDQGLKLAAFCTGPGIRRTGANLISEIIGTFVLVLVVLSIGSSNSVNGVGQWLVASLVWGIGLSLGGTTGFAINPARDLGSRIAHAVLPVAGKGPSDWKYAAVPVVGPFTGGALAALLALGFGL